MSGRLLGIYMTAEKGQDLTRYETAVAVAGRGLEGDRNLAPEGERQKPHKQVTLIEQEALSACARDYHLPLKADMVRRNLLTEGVALNHLVGREFSVGPVRLRGVELCEPCGYLERLTVTGALKALLHRGGLRAEILEGGTLTAGDAVEVDEAG